MTSIKNSQLVNGVVLFADELEKQQQQKSLASFKHVYVAEGILEKKKLEREGGMPLLKRGLPSPS